MIKTTTKYLDNKFYRADWNYAELIEFCKQSEGKTLAKEKASEYNDYLFNGSTGYKETMRIATDGWQVAIDKIKKAIDKFTVIGKGVTFSPVFEVYGESVEIGRFLSGEPDCMQEWEAVETKGNRVVDFYLNVCTSAGSDIERITYYGAAVLAIVDFLESSNIRCNLYVYDATSLYTQKENYLICVKIKSANEPLNIPVASFAMCHPAMLRRVFFKCQEMDKDFMNGKGGNNIYGAPTNFPKEVITTEKDSVNFGSVETQPCNFRNETDCIDFIKNKIPELLNELTLDINFNQNL